MRTLIGALGCFVPLLLIAVFCFLFIRQPTVRNASVRAMVKYGRKYLKKNPKADEDGLREALEYRFMPERPEHRRDQDQLGCLLFGLGYLVGAATGRWLKDTRFAYESKQVRARIEATLDELLGEPEPLERGRSHDDDDDENVR